MAAVFGLLVASVFSIAVFAVVAVAFPTVASVVIFCSIVVGFDGERLWF